jgi:hypothetical protein
MDLTEISSNGVNRISLAQNWVKWRAAVNKVVTSGLQKMRKIFLVSGGDIRFHK